MKTTQFAVIVLMLAQVGYQTSEVDHEQYWAILSVIAVAALFVCIFDLLWNGLEGPDDE